MLVNKEQFFQALDRAHNIAIFFNADWTLDSVAAGLALRALLQNLDKQVYLIADLSTTEDRYNFLPDFTAINNILPPADEFIISLDLERTKIKQIKSAVKNNTLEIKIKPQAGSWRSSDLSGRNAGFGLDLAIIINAPDLNSLGAPFQDQPDLFYQTPLINITADGSADDIGQINLLDQTASGASEIIYNLFNNPASPLTIESATCLLAGLIGATNNFRSAGVKPQTLNAAATLLAQGAKRDLIINRLYRDQKLTGVKLWGQAMSQLTLSPDCRLAWTVFDYNEIKNSGLKRFDLILLMEEILVNLAGVEIIIIFVARGQETSALLYNLKNHDLMTLAAAWNPQGTSRLAQILITEPSTQAVKLVIGELSQRLSI